MLVRIFAVSGYVPPLDGLRQVDGQSFIEITSLGQVWRLRTDIGSRIIIDVWDDGSRVLLIYDDYLE